MSCYWNFLAKADQLFKEANGLIHELIAHEAEQIDTDKKKQQ
jgi:hypothetical protein